jgi:hypothetical protein
VADASVAGTDAPSCASSGEASASRSGGVFAFEPLFDIGF